MSSINGTSGGMLGQLTNLFSAGPAKPGDSFGAPGRGKSTNIAVLTTLVLFALWYVVTAGADPLFKPLFLPSPGAVWNKFVAVMTEGYQDRTLLQHTEASLVRIFAAFFLAVLIRRPNDRPIVA